MGELSIEKYLLIYKYHTQRETSQHKIGQLTWTLGQVCTSLHSNMMTYINIPAYPCWKCDKVSYSALVSDSRLSSIVSNHRLQAPWKASTGVSTTNYWTRGVLSTPNPSTVGYWISYPLKSKGWNQPSNEAFLPKTAFWDMFLLPYARRLIVLRRAVWDAA